MSKAALLEALDGVEAGPTTVERSVRGAASASSPCAAGARTRSRSRRSRGWPTAAEALAADAEVRLVAHHRRRHADLLRRRRPEGASRGCPARRSPAAGRRRSTRLAALAVPTVALLNGHVVGGGIDLRPGLRLADRRRGRQAALHPQRARLHAAVGRRRAARRSSSPPRVALRLFATCELVSSQEARTIGHRRRGGRPAQAALAGRVARRADRARPTGEALAGDQAAAPPGVAAEEHTRAFAALWDARRRYPSRMSLTSEDVFEACGSSRIPSSAWTSSTSASSTR